MLTDLTFEKSLGFTTLRLDCNDQSIDRALAEIEILKRDLLEQLPTLIETYIHPQVEIDDEFHVQLRRILQLS